MRSLRAECQLFLATAATDSHQSIHIRQNVGFGSHSVSQSKERGIQHRASAHRRAVASSKFGNREQSPRRLSKETNFFSQRRIGSAARPSVTPHWRHTSPTRRRKRIASERPAERGDLGRLLQHRRDAREKKQDRLVSVEKARAQKQGLLCFVRRQQSVPENTRSLATPLRRAWRTLLTGTERVWSTMLVISQRFLRSTQL